MSDTVPLLSRPISRLWQQEPVEAAGETALELSGWLSPMSPAFLAGALRCPLDGAAKCPCYREMASVVRVEMIIGEEAHAGSVEDR